MDDKLKEQVETLGKKLVANEIKIVTAESCTGGGLAKLLTTLPGSSAWFDRGFVTYSNQSKVDMLGVLPGTIDTYGAVSKETVLEMVVGALRLSNAQVAIAITGIAGPNGGTTEKPVGTVCFAWYQAGKKPIQKTHHFEGDRESICAQATVFALSELLSITSP